MSGQTQVYRAKRDLIAQWLWDNLDHDDDAPWAMYWPDSADLIKFLKANGYEIRPSE